MCRVCYVGLLVRYSILPHRTMAGLTKTGSWRFLPDWGILGFLWLWRTRNNSVGWSIQGYPQEDVLYSSTSDNRPLWSVSGFLQLFAELSHNLCNHDGPFQVRGREYLSLKPVFSFTFIKPKNWPTSLVYPNFFNFKWSHENRLLAYYVRNFTVKMFSFIFCR